MCSGCADGNQRARRRAREGFLRLGTFFVGLNVNYKGESHESLESLSRARTFVTFRFSGYPQRDSRSLYFKDFVINGGLDANLM